jgi:hypothetical protein
MARDCVSLSRFLSGLRGNGLASQVIAQLEKQKRRIDEIPLPQVSSGISLPHHTYIIRVDFIKYPIIVDMKIYICLTIYHSIHN